MCDDLTLTVDGLSVQTADELPDYCRHSYERASLTQEPDCLVAGKPVSLEDALSHAAKLLKQSKQTLFGGLAVDVNGARAALRLAALCGGIVDQQNTPVTSRYAQVVQNEGWANCTLSEARNRADMIVVLGTLPLEKYPRLAERLVPGKLGKFQKQAPEWVLIGPWQEKAELLETRMKGQNYQILPLDTEQTDDCPRILGALAEGNSTAPDDDWQKWFDHLLTKQFVVFSWSYAEYSQPALQTLAKFIKKVNRKIRCAGLPMSGSQGDATFHQVCTWQYGVPSRAKLSERSIDYEPTAYDTGLLLEQNAVDLLVWVTPLDTAPHPETDVPVIRLCHPSYDTAQKTEVFIPCGIPGVDHPGHLTRTDSVALLKLKQVRDSKLPAAPALLDELGRRFTQA